MATVTENLHSREGDELGQRGAFARREFNVILDSSEDQNAPLTPLEEEVAIGSLHPDPFFAGLFASQYRKLERKEGTTGFWVCEIDYAPPLVFQTAGWDIRFQSSVESKPITHDLGGRRIGGNTYDIVDDNTSPSGQLYTADTKDGEQKLTLVARSGQTSAIVHPYPVQVFSPVASMTLGKQIPDTQLTLAQLQVVNGFSTIINSDARPDLGLEKWQLMYMGGTAFKRALRGAADTTSIIAWDVVLEFRINYDTYLPTAADSDGSDDESVRSGERIGGWRKLQFFDWYEKGGFRGDVHKGAIGGPIVAKTFNLYRERNFDSLFAPFGGLTKIIEGVLTPRGQ